ncbi:Rieske (2Fe-2S) protein [Coralloluteibacterium stylophorae]|uniref:Rieske 2Fe-2S domain-containing protein n=1 Tax=Coralloluteibacterium stylophorae TaxID=1776034 RepID=A0A8J7VU82_9GAMM|nr:Rieske 2Fe-2S domain-containing protein [Coralloluteibacterium stylophorae]MBS7458357.1 Rieske 2Fe-2S domain-containing protein [Coralloluteibacterium stylophorae]
MNVIGSLIEASRIPATGALEIEAEVDGEAQSLMLMRVSGSVRAYLNVCPHAGRRLDWAPGQFLFDKGGHIVCAAHGASFRSDDGVCVGGPCRGEALVAVAVEERDGQVWLVDATGAGLTTAG